LQIGVMFYDEYISKMSATKDKMFLFGGKDDIPNIRLRQN
jgi:hypothetical protein